MSKADDGSQSGGRVDVAICVDDDALARLEPAVRHLCVGLVDLSAGVRVIAPRSSEGVFGPLGPIDVFAHDEPVWPFRRGRVRKIVEFLSARAPSVIYAIGSGAYSWAWEPAEAFDVDIVVQVTSSRDVETLLGMRGDRIAHVIAASTPLHDHPGARGATGQLSRTLVRPGVLRGTELTCFRDPERHPTLVCGAPLESESGLEVLIEATAKVREAGHSLLTFLPGEGSGEAAIRRLIRVNNLEAAVTLARPVGDAHEVLRGADMYLVAPGERDVSAHTLRAMASGTCVLCFPETTADYLIADQTAIECAERSAEALAEAITSVLKDPGRGQRVAEAAREYVREHHSMSASAERTFEVLRSVSLRGQTFPMHG